MTIAQRRSVRPDLAALLDTRSIVPVEDAAPYERVIAIVPVAPRVSWVQGAIDELRTVVDYCVRRSVRFVVQVANAEVQCASNPDRRRTGCSSISTGLLV